MPPHCPAWQRVLPRYEVDATDDDLETGIAAHVVEDGIDIQIDQGASALVDGFVQPLQAGACIA